MNVSLMPCFEPNQAFAEGVIIGRLLAGYGELEVEMCACFIAVEGMLDLPIRRLFNERGAGNRIKIAEKALTGEYTKASLQVELAEALDDMEWCRKIRNQYAHCQWYWTSQDGLCFVNLEELAKQPSPIIALMSNRHSLDVPLLKAQEEYFNYLKECFKYLETAYRAWNQAQSLPRRPAYVFPRPSNVTQPPLHN
jgi:hypothetical protein